MHIIRANWLRPALSARTFLLQGEAMEKVGKAFEADGAVGKQFTSKGSVGARLTPHYEP